MHKIFILMLLSAIFLFSAGCAKYWYQEGKSFGECKQDQAKCFAELQKHSDFSNPTVEYEIKFMNDCMMEKGYREVSQDKLPLDAKRQGPESSFHWRARGIAGTLTKP
jgi:hypothetical protein